MTSALPGTRSRPAHVPPVPTGQLPDPGGATPADRCFNLQKQALDLYNAWRDSIPDGVSADDLRNNAGAFLTADANIGLPDALAAVKADADEAAGKVNELLNGVRVDGDTASQVAAQRFWDRTRRKLDSIQDRSKAVSAAQDIVRSASGPEVAALREELGDYLGTRGLPSGWLPSAFAAAVPGLGEAEADAVRKSRQHALVLANHNALQRAFSKDVALGVPLHDPSAATSAAYSNPTGM